MEQTDVLEGAGDAGAVYLGGAHVGGVLAVEQDRAVGGLIHLGEKVEDRGLARAVGADEARDLGAAEGEVKVLHGLQAAEGDAQIDALEDGRLVHVALRHVIGSLDRDDRGNRFQTRTTLFAVTHDALASFSLSLLNLLRREAM